MIDLHLCPRDGAFDCDNEFARFTFVAGVILVVLGLCATGLGPIEIVAPNVFDEMGGGYLDVLYGLR